MRLSSRLGIIGLALALTAGCGSDTAQTPTAAAPPTPGPTAPTTGPQYLAIEVPTSNPSVATAEILNPSGRVVAQHSEIGYATAGPAGVYLVDQQKQLLLLRPNGTTSTLASLSVNTANTFAGLVVGPDGATVAYSIVSWNTSTTPIQSLSSIYVVLPGQPARLLRQLPRTEAATSKSGAALGGGYAPITWNAGGILLGTLTQDFRSTGAYPVEELLYSEVVALDPLTGKLGGSVTPATCRFAAAAADGSLACLQGQAADVTQIVVAHPNKTGQTYDPGSNTGVGTVYFLNSTATGIVFTTASGSSPNYSYTLKTGSTMSGRVSTLGSQLLPGGVMRDGTILAERLPCAASTGGPRSCSFVTVNSTTGAMTPLATGDRMIGVVG